MKQNDKLGLICEKIIDYLYKGSSKNEREVMVYGLKVLLSTIGGYLLITIFSSLLGITSLALTAAITAGIIKIFSGGVHASSFRNCALIGSIVFVGLGSIAHSVGPLLENKLWIMLWFVFLFGAIIIYFYSPAGIKEKPIVSKKKRFFFKIYSFVVQFILLLFYFVLNLKDGSNQIILAGLLGVVWQMFTITPLAYKLFGREYIKEVIINENEKSIS